MTNLPYGRRKMAPGSFRLGFNNVWIVIGFCSRKRTSAPYLTECNPCMLTPEIPRWRIVKSSRIKPRTEEGALTFDRAIGVYGVAYRRRGAARKPAPPGAALSGRNGLAFWKLGGATGGGAFEAYPHFAVNRSVEAAEEVIVGAIKYISKYTQVYRHV